jgi:hypothetical protein
MAVFRHGRGGLSRFGTLCPSVVARTSSHANHVRLQLSPNQVVVLEGGSSNAMGPLLAARPSVSNYRRIKWWSSRELCRTRWGCLPAARRPSPTIAESSGGLRGSFVERYGATGPPPADGSEPRPWSRDGSVEAWSVGHPGPPVERRPRAASSSAGPRHDARHPKPAGPEARAAQDADVPWERRACRRSAPLVASHAACRDLIRR